MVGHRVSMLGTGLIGLFYTRTLHGQRNRDRVHVVYSRSEERAKAFCTDNDVPVWTTDLEEAIAHPETDTVVIGLPNQLHEEAVELCAKHGKAVLCTKPLARTAEEAKRMLDTAEHRLRRRSGCSTPPSRKASSPAISRTSSTPRRR